MTVAYSLEVNVQQDNDWQQLICFELELYFSFRLTSLQIMKQH